jgi:class 3 adenylate cyclase
LATLIQEIGWLRDAMLLGVHAGPSMVVTLNDRLDYFGSTVNMAARLQDQSAGGNIVLSRAVAGDPAVDRKSVV